MTIIKDLNNPRLASVIIKHSYLGNFYIFSTQWKSKELFQIWHMLQKKSSQPTFISDLEKKAYNIFSFRILSIKPDLPKLIENIDSWNVDNKFVY